MSARGNAPKLGTWIICLVLGIIALIGSLFTIGFITDLAPWIALVGLGLMLAATKLEGL